jgi:hypothetical protein
MRLAIITLAAGAAALSTAGLASLAMAATASPLPPAPPKGTGLPSGQCIRSHDIRNHTVADSKTLLMSVQNRGVYRVTMAGSCLAGAVSSDPIITRNPPGTNIICKPIEMDIAISKSGFKTPCIVDSIVKLSPEQVSALPRKLKP